MNLDWRKALRESSIDQTAKLIGFVLDTYADRQGYCFPGRQTIAAGASCDVRTVDQALRRLESKGFVSVERSRGRQPNRYWLLDPNGEPGSRLTVIEDRGYGESGSASTANFAASNGDAASPEVGLKPVHNRPVKPYDRHRREEEAASPDPDVLELLRRAQRGEFVQRMPA